MRDHDQGVQDEEHDHQPGQDALDPRLQLALGLERQEDRAVDREHRHRRHADQQGERRQQVDERGPDVAVGVDRHAAQDVAEGDAEEQRQARPRRAQKTVSQAERQRGECSLLRNSMATVRRIITSSTSMNAR